MPRPALPEPKLRRSRCPRDPKDQQLKFTQLNWLLSVFVDNSWEGRRHDMGLSHSLWVCFLVFKSHLCVARAKHKMFKESDLSRKARATSTPSTFRTELRCFTGEHLRTPVRSRKHQHPDWQAGGRRISRPLLLL